ncbi:NAD(P)-dependent alcohol dehydrogenase [Roseivirga sp. E12]|uniref:NAD(P)-dependent alcohol dehydrogenase n=1 Tax=Roseivirga sp. E12 TaxID=2819237 RepID=UPI001ABC1128|nr:NAD(P)-dependent alcohol dehydrogenase [Roseivirga sp. E12]MBO3697938.1 NAD(P)-dependent alcohol dehydrogenase [Roseivirga sp. E12]
MKSYIRNSYGGPEVLELIEMPIPEPKANEVLIKIKAASINPADWRIMRADPFLVRTAMGVFKPKFKHIGADVSGIIETVGTSVLNWEPGDEVVSDIMRCGMGAYGEYVAVPQELLVRKPKNVSFGDAAAVPIAGLTAFQALMDYGKLQSGQRVLINGSSGGVGTYAVQIAKHYGAHVTGVCSSHNKEMVRGLGADQVIAYDLEDYRNPKEKYDLILDNVGNCSFKAAKAMLKTEGISLLIGWGGFSHMINYMVQGGMAKLTGSKTFKGIEAKMDTGDLESLMELLSIGAIRSVIDKSFPMEQLKEAILLQEKGRTKGKIIVHN